MKYKIPYRVILFSVLFLFSCWLMFHTFSYDGRTHDIKIAFKLWSDFGAHIPLIRSFSMGNNLSNFLSGKPVQYPVFSGPPIRYHFLFDMLVGVLEKTGIRIDWALNIPSILGFFGLTALIYLLGVELFGSVAVGGLSVLFFLFNGSLSFLRYFAEHPIYKFSVQEIYHLRDFPAFAPWGPGEIAAFWNLNVYTNQRQLAPAFALILLFVLYIVRRKKNRPVQYQIIEGVLWGLTFALFPYFHQPSLLIVALFLLIYVLLFPQSRVTILLTGIVSGMFIIPQILGIPGEAKVLEWYPGFIIHNEIYHQPFLRSAAHMLTFWWQNFGLHGILIIIGFFFIPKRARNTLLPIIPLFILPNLFKFSIEASANHKFFNFVLILGQMISAYMIVRIFRAIRRLGRHWIVTVFSYYVVILCIVFLTLSGVIDFIVIANDKKGNVADIPNNEAAAWIAKNTDPSAIFLNSDYLYHPASIAGRSIFLGWPYFAWSAGYKENRMPVMNSMYNTKDSSRRCALLKKNNISYITVQDVLNDTNLPDIDLGYFLRSYTPSFVSKDGRMAIFSTASLCLL